MRWRNAIHGSGGVAVSRSWLYSGSPPISTISSFSDGGASAMSTFAILRVNDSLRRLPTSTATVWSMDSPGGVSQGAGSTPHGVYAERKGLLTLHAFVPEGAGTFHTRSACPCPTPVVRSP